MNNKSVTEIYHEMVDNTSESPGDTDDRVKTQVVNEEAERLKQAEQFAREEWQKHPYTEKFIRQLQADAFALEFLARQQSYGTVVNPLVQHNLNISTTLMKVIEYARTGKSSFTN